MLYLMEEVHRLPFNNASTGLLDLNCVFTTFWGTHSFSNLVLISPSAFLDSSFTQKHTITKIGRETVPTGSQGILLRGREGPA